MFAIFQSNPPNVNISTKDNKHMLKVDKIVRGEKLGHLETKTVALEVVVCEWLMV